MLSPYARVLLNDGNRPDRRGTLRRGARKAGRRPIKERTRRPEDAPPFAVSHPIKLAALIVLHEGAYSAGEVADILGLDVKNVANHLRGLYEAGCIEFVGYEGEGNITKAIYRAVARPFVSDETYREMSTEERHDANGSVLQWILAECLSSYRTYKMDQDDDLCLISDEPNLDTQGRREIRDLFKETAWAKPDDTPEIRASVQEIECRAANRMAESGEDGTTMVVVLLAFERGHPGRSEQPSL